MDLGRFALCHYDADHSYDATLKACRLLLRCSAPLAVHDADWTEPRRAIDDLVRESGRRMRLVGRLAMLEIV